MSARYVVKLTLEQAEKLGIVKCESCGWPRNNHFDWGTMVCAHSVGCTGWKPRFTFGKAIAKGKRRATKSPIHRKR